jgi:hypothetical protein
MKLESPSFTTDDIRAFMSSYRDRERNLLADRLQHVSERLADLGPRVQTQSGGGEAEEWNAHEILAHIAVVSKFYGVLVHRIASGKLEDMNLLEAVNLRDAAGQQMAQLPQDELVRMSVADQQRTIQALRAAEDGALQRAARVDDGTSMTAEEVARLPLVSHLEMHIEQLEKMLASR